MKLSAIPFVYLLSSTNYRFFTTVSSAQPESVRYFFCAKKKKILHATRHTHISSSWSLLAAGEFWCIVKYQWTLKVKELERMIDAKKIVSFKTRLLIDVSSTSIKQQFQRQSTFDTLLIFFFYFRPHSLWLLNELFSCAEEWKEMEENERRNWMETSSECEVLMLWLGSFVKRLGTTIHA